MASAAKQPSRGLTPGKLGLIILLSIILLVVLVVQFGGGGSETVAARRQPRRNRTQDQDERPSPNKQTAGDSEADKDETETTWPAFSVQDVLAHNPFALPLELRPGAASNSEAGETETVEAVTTAEEETRRQAILELRQRQREFMASLKEQGVDMIVMTPQGRVARIGDLSVRVGDRIAGLRVQEINAGGIVFTQAPTSTEKNDESKL